MLNSGLPPADRHVEEAAEWKSTLEWAKIARWAGITFARCADLAGVVPERQTHRLGKDPKMVPTLAFRPKPPLIRATHFGQSP
jgi:hypothetical protein